MTKGFRKWVTSSVLIAVLTVVLGLAGCTDTRVETPELPKSISPGWKLAGFELVKDQWRGTYAGPGTAHVRIWATHGSAEGLDRVQNWKAQPNTVVISSDRYFAAVDWTGVDRDQAGALVRALERAIK